MNDEYGKQTHTVSITAREKAELTGISEVESFQESGIVLAGCMGGITVEGESLKIDSFSVETGKIIISGKIDGLFYFEKTKNRGGIFSRFSR